MSLCPGASAAVLTAGSHSPGDEGRDHPEAAGPQLWSNREHQQLPQPVRAATHQCQVGRIIPRYPRSSIIKVIFSSPLGVLSPPFFSAVLSTCCHAWIARVLFSSPPLCLYSLHTPILFLVLHSNQFRVNPPRLRSEVISPSAEESTSSAADGVLHIFRAHKSQLTSRSSLKTC